MIKINEPAEAFVLKIQSLYDIEHQLEKALPKLAKASEDEDLKNGFNNHLEETKNHIKRLEQIFEMLGLPPKKEKCEGIRGIIEDSDAVAKLRTPTTLKNSLIAGAARYAEHYEIAGYMSAIEEAKLLGLPEIGQLLEETLAEEQKADQLLESIVQKDFKN